MTIWIVIWGLTILGAIVADIAIPRGGGNRNGSKYIGK